MTLREKEKLVKNMIREDNNVTISVYMDALKEIEGVERFSQDRGFMKAEIRRMIKNVRA